MPSPCLSTEEVQKLWLAGVPEIQKLPTLYDILTVQIQARDGRTEGGYISQGVCVS